MEIFVYIFFSCLFVFVFSEVNRQHQANHDFARLFVFSLWSHDDCLLFSKAAQNGLYI